MSELVDKSQKLIYSMTPTEVTEVQETFVELDLIKQLSKNPDTEINRLLKDKKKKAKGKVKKIYQMMRKGNNLMEGIDNHSTELVSAKSKKYPVIKDCPRYPSDDYVTHSFGPDMCNSPNNETKLCSESNCPYITEELMEEEKDQT